MPIPRSLPRDQVGQNPQRLLGALLADYTFEGTAGVTSTAVIRILAEFGISESGARSALSRAVARALLEATRVDGVLRYRLGEWGRRQHEGRVRAVVEFGASEPAWDGQWTLAVYPSSLGDRAERRRWATRLREEGFGRLADGVWIHPWIPADDVRAQASASDVPVAVTRGPLLWDGMSVADAFDLEAVRDAYEAFLGEYEPVQSGAQVGDVHGADALRAHTSVLREWRRLALGDPGLPADALPADWPSTRARDVFITVRRLLAPAALAHLRTLVDADVADLVVASPIAEGR